MTKFVRDAKIRTRLIPGFGVVLGLLMLLTGIGVRAIKEIAGTITEVNQIATAIARSLQKASNGTGVVSSLIGDVRQAAAETGAASADLLTASDALSVQAASLSAQVNRFLATIPTTP